MLLLLGGALWVGGAMADEPCVVVESLISAEALRGQFETPYSLHLKAGQSAEEREMDIAESHGESYLRCRFRVRIGDAAYRYDLIRSTTLEPERGPAWCETAAARAEVARQIVERTEQCTDLEGGWFYFGVKLEPLETP